MKYKKENVVNAIYTNNGINQNPYIDAMPEILSQNQFLNEIASFPIYGDFSHLSKEDRKKFLPQLNSFFYPFDYMYYIYDMLYRAIIENYSSKNVIETIRQINRLRGTLDEYDQMVNFSTQSYSGAILGVPGIGKSSTIKRSLSLIPQVIIHTEYNQIKLYKKQITYLCVECPCDCSVKTLAANIILAIDQAIDSNYFEEVIKNKRLSSASALAMKVKIACLNHRVGLLVIDEIQNAVITAEKTKQLRPLVKFLVELTNESCVSICFSGTIQAEQIFCSQEHLKRRTRGYRLLPLKPDKTYFDFITKLWDYQILLKQKPLKEDIANCIYNYSAGIPAYIVKIFMEAQSYAIMQGKESININIIKNTISNLNIAVNRTYSGGQSISDFSIHSDTNYCEEIGNDENQEIKKEQSEFIYKKKGRPTGKREDENLIELYKKTENIDEFIKRTKELQILEYYEGE